MAVRRPTSYTWAVNALRSLPLVTLLTLCVLSAKVCAAVSPRDSVEEIIRLENLRQQHILDSLRHEIDAPLSARQESLKTKYLARFRAATSVAVYELAPWGTTERIASVGHAWRDAFIEMVSAPGAVGRPIDKLTSYNITSMVTMSSKTSTDTVYFVTSQFIMDFKGAGPLSLGYDKIVGPLHNHIHSALDRGRWQGERDTLGVESYDSPPGLRKRPGPMPATTSRDPVFCLIRIGADGQVKELKAPAGQRLPNAAVCSWLRALQYYPALKNSKKVESWVPFGIRPPPPKK